MGTAGSFEGISIVAVCGPVTGTKRTLNLQEPFGGKVVPEQESSTKTKAALSAVIAPMIRSFLPFVVLFLMVKIAVLVRVSLTFPYFFLEGVTLIVGSLTKVAVTVWSSLMTMVQVLAVPVQAPDHPLNTEFASALALSFIVVPRRKVSWHELPQLMVARVFVTTPVPEPVLSTVRVLYSSRPAHGPLIEPLVVVLTHRPLL